MAKSNYELKIKSENDCTDCELYEAGRLVASGRVKEGLYTGPWAFSTRSGGKISLNFDGFSRQGDLSPDALVADIPSLAIRTYLDSHPMPQWMLEINLDKINWAKIEDYSRWKSVKRFGMFLQAYMSDIPMVQDFILPGLHIGTVDEDTLNPVTSEMVAIFAKMLEQPGVYSPPLVQILKDIVGAIQNAEIDKTQEINDEESIYGKNMLALKNSIPSLKKHSDQDPNTREAINQVIEVIEGWF